MRTFATVCPYVTAVRGSGGYGFYMLGSMEPLTLDPTVARTILERPGVVEDISGAYDSPKSTVDAWIEEFGRQTWMADDELRAYVGNGPLITEDQPRPEYFLLRPMFGE